MLFPADPRSKGILTRAQWVLRIWLALWLRMWRCFPGRGRTWMQCVWGRGVLPAPDANATRPHTLGSQLCLLFSTIIILVITATAWIKEREIYYNFVINRINCPTYQPTVMSLDIMCVLVLYLQVPLMSSWEYCRISLTRAASAWRKPKLAQSIQSCLQTQSKQLNKIRCVWSANS